MRYITIFIKMVVHYTEHTNIFRKQQVKMSKRFLCCRYVCVFHHVHLLEGIGHIHYIHLSSQQLAGCFLWVTHWGNAGINSTQSFKFVSSQIGWRLSDYQLQLVKGKEKDLLFYPQNPVSWVFLFCFFKQVPFIKFYISLTCLKH